MPDTETLIYDYPPQDAVFGPAVHADVVYCLYR